MSELPHELAALPQTGTPAPPFTLPDLDGRPTTLADLTATHHLVLFFMREFT